MTIKHTIGALLCLFFTYLFFNTSEEESLRDRQGSWLLSARNFVTLQDYYVKLMNCTITPAEIDDYIEKGGNFNFLESYSLMERYFVGSASFPLLNTFIDGAYRGQLESTPLPPDRLESIKRLLEAGANPNVENPKSLWRGLEMPPVLFAASGDDQEALELLLESGANANLVSLHRGDINPAPPLALANQTDTLDLLLRYGADPFYKNQYGQSLLHISIRHMSLEKMQWLINKGLSVNHKDSLGETASDVLRGHIKTLGVSKNEEIEALKNQIKLLEKVEKGSK